MGARPALGGSMLALLAAALLSGCATGLPVRATEIRAGTTTDEEVRERFGAPDEIDGDASTVVWVYRDGFRVPAMISFLPVVGDVADVAETAMALRGRHELIIQFDTHHVVRRVRVRAAD